MPSLAKGIIITGFMGTGKTTVGKLLSQRLKIPFVDLDDEIEREAGASVGEIFDARGEKAFREIESRTLERVLGEGVAVIATGGGAVMDGKNVSLMKSYGVVISLRSKPGEIVRRLEGDESRPLLTRVDRLEKVTKMMKDRKKYYDLCDLSVDTDGREVEDIADEIINELRGEG